MTIYQSAFQVVFFMLFIGYIAALIGIVLVVGLEFVRRVSWQDKFCCMGGGAILIVGLSGLMFFVEFIINITP